MKKNDTDNLKPRDYESVPQEPYRVGLKDLPHNALEIVEDMARRGCSVISISRALRISSETFYQWRKKGIAPELFEAFAAGRAREHDTLVGDLHRASKAGNVVAALFLLKCRHGYREGEHADGRAGNVQISINMPGASKPDHYVTAKVVNELPEGDGDD